jgi:hypothetical protein
VVVFNLNKGIFNIICPRNSHNAPCEVLSQLEFKMTSVHYRQVAIQATQNQFVPVFSNMVRSDSMYLHPI